MIELTIIKVNNILQSIGDKYCTNIDNFCLSCALNLEVIYDGDY